MKRLHLTLIAISLVGIMSACTDYTTKEEKAKAEMAKEAITKAEEDAAIKEAMMQQSLQDSIEAAIDSLTSELSLDLQEGI